MRSRRAADVYSPSRNARALRFFVGAMMRLGYFILLRWEWENLQCCPIVRDI